ncbi:FHA domain-containing protein [Pyrobaculum neutrophilum]|uniref:FHA domain containing protein n=1 Tax=Pyrobaculum neutrophilum (strain DSM 2338 / JCM 9278 / NBRC 100436 / V24Sta) TaxID=444157 RepID=B1YA41_PYRNV|nr:FHA domain-containing protein [Pyrobaculum neutrophilum]ACB39015.1 FHA domain containing protein [Pyrobaculum neutrophilum V24Sta]
MPWKCPVCGAENRDEDLTCKICGAYKPEATTKKVAQIPRETATAVLAVEVLESPVESLVGKRFEFRVNSPGVIVTVGRAVDNQIVVPDPAVSRRHMRLIATAGGVVVEDLGSSNGTYLVEGGGERLIKVESVGKQAVVRIGNTRLRVALV